MFSDIRCDDDLASASRRLCAQSSSLRSRLRSSLDSGDLPAAIDLAERSVGNDCVVALLAMAQCVERDADDDFRPVGSKSAADGDVRSSALIDAADAGLATLGALYEVGAARLESQGWVPVGQSSATTGGIVYRHEETGETSEEPEIDEGATSWEARLILSIPALISPGVVRGKVTWAATVIYYRHAGKDGGEGSGLDLEACDGSSSECVSVIDVLKGDEDGDRAVLRGIHNCRWRGLYAEAMGEMEMSDSIGIGRNLELWTETTLAGMSVSKNCGDGRPRRVLVVGLAGGQLVSFLRRHVENVELDIVESSQIMVDIAREHFGLGPSELECVTVGDPMKCIQSKKRCRAAFFDTVMVNACGGEDAFPSHLLDMEFFKDLVSLLSDRPDATLLVNSGTSSDAVASLVGDVAGVVGSGRVSILREHLLRDRVAGGLGAGVVAARRCEWTLSVEDWRRECVGEDAAQASGSMNVADAQRTEVVRIEKFLSHEEIEAIHGVARSELAGFGKGEMRGDSWRVLYLQHKDVFRRRLPDLRRKVLAAARQVDSDSKWHLFNGVDHVNIRVVEYHQMEDRGELSDPKHYDLNSLVTMDVMLSEDGSFGGGGLRTLEADGTLKKHAFGQGDALLFVSHKYHCVGRVTSGRRNVMVIEFWHGAERRCNHRCERFGAGVCQMDPGQDDYTRRHASSNRAKAPSSSTVPLPFRLGSASVVSLNDRSQETLELLWEPSENGRQTSSLDIETKDKVLNDLFGDSSSDSSDDDDSD